MPLQFSNGINVRGAVDLATLAATPATPATGTARLYAKPDGRAYSLGSDGVEIGPFAHLSPKWRAGNVYGPPAATTTSTPPNGELRWAPFYVPNSVTIDQLTAEIATAGSTGALARLGLAPDNAGQPGALLVDAGTAAATASGGVAITLAATRLLAPGWYWGGVVTQGAPATLPVMRALNGALPGCPLTAGSSAGTWVQTAVTGALPATPTSTASPVPCPRFGVRVSAVS